MTIIILEDSPYQIVYVSCDIVDTMHVHIIYYSVIYVTEQKQRQTMVHFYSKMHQQEDENASGKTRY